MHKLTAIQLVIIKTEGNIQQMEQSINQVVILKTFIDSIKPVWQALTAAASQELRKICQVCTMYDRCLNCKGSYSYQLCDPANYRRVEDLVSSTLNEDVTHSAKPLEMRNQRTYAIKVTFLSTCQ
jgi:DNA mismatch repair protein MSH4